MKIKLLFLFFALSLSAIIGGAVFYSSELENENALANGFGIGPPYVQCGTMKIGEECERKIMVMRSEPEGEARVITKVTPPELEKMVSFDPGPGFSFASDAIRIEETVKIKVPEGACGGKYSGAIYFIASGPGSSAGVSIALGARADVSFTVEGAECAVPEKARAASSVKNKKLYERLKGRILINVGGRGRAYYIPTGEMKIYPLGSPSEALDILSRFKNELGIPEKELKRPPDALRIIRQKGLGISSRDFKKI